MDKNNSSLEIQTKNKLEKIYDRMGVSLTTAQDILSSDILPEYRDLIISSMELVKENRNGLAEMLA